MVVIVPANSVRCSGVPGYREFALVSFGGRADKAADRPLQAGIMAAIRAAWKACQPDRHSPAGAHRRDGASTKMERLYGRPPFDGRRWWRQILAREPTQQ